MEGRIYGIIGFLRSNPNVIPNVNELIETLVLCSREAEDESLNSLIENFVGLETSMLVGKGITDEALFDLINDCKSRAMRRDAMEEQEGHFIAKLASVYDDVVRNPGGYDNSNEFLELVYKKDKYLKEREDAPDYVEMMFDYIEAHYHPMKKIRFVNQILEENPGIDPNARELMELLSLYNDPNGNNELAKEDEETVESLVQTATLRAFNNGIITDVEDPLISVLWEARSNFLSGKSMHPTQSRYAILLSGVYFFIKQKERDHGHKFIFDNDSEYEELAKLRNDEDIRTLSVKMYSGLDEMMSFVESRYYKTREKNEEPVVPYQP